MISATKKFNDIMSSSTVVYLGTLSSISGFAWFLYDKMSQNELIWSSIAFGFSISIFLIAFVYSISVRNEVLAFRSSIKSLCDVNRIYRDSLNKVFFNAEDNWEPDNILREQEETLAAICQRICKVYTGLICRECVVTIKLLTKDASQKYHAETYTRSENQSLRDNDERTQFKVETGDNTAFDQAILKNQTSSKLAHYFSADLKKSKGYTNQRVDYKKYYRSVLVVPIRGITYSNAKEVKSTEYDDIGFLCIDTRSTNRLNNGYHLNLLVAFSNQMYNFISLMRKNYTLFEGENQDEDTA